MVSVTGESLNFKVSRNLSRESPSKDDLQGLCGLCESLCRLFKLSPPRNKVKSLKALL